MDSFAYLHRLVHVSVLAAMLGCTADDDVPSGNATTPTAPDDAGVSATSSSEGDDSGSSGSDDGAPTTTDGSKMACAASAECPSGVCAAVFSLQGTPGPEAFRCVEACIPNDTVEWWCIDTDACCDSAATCDGFGYCIVAIETEG